MLAAELQQVMGPLLVGWGLGTPPFPLELAFPMKPVNKALAAELLHNVGAQLNHAIVFTTGSPPPPEVVLQGYAPRNRAA